MTPENIIGTAPTTAPPRGVVLAYSVEEAAAAAGLSRSQLYIELDAGRLRGRKVGRRRLILADDLAEWLAALPAS